MMPPASRGYDRGVYTPRLGARRASLAGALIALGILVLAAPAAATTVSYDVGDQAIVQLQARASVLTVKTWDRNTIEVTWPDGEPFVPFRTARQWNTTSFPIQAAPNMTEYEGPNGPVTASFAPEDFPLPGIALGLHDIVKISDVSKPADAARRATTDQTHLTVTIPASTGVLFVQQGRGELSVSDYHGTTIAFSRGTRVALSNVSGSAFIQNMFGHVYAVNSNFSRLRVRTNHADQVYEQCNIKQIDVQSLTGSIVYDNGSFEPGLAHFESDRGSIALGLTGNAQVATHTVDGKIYSMIGRNPSSVEATGNDQMFVFGGGGTLVNASSIHGNVYAYDGTIADRLPGNLSAQWRPIFRTLWSKRAHLPGNITYPRTRVIRPEAHQRIKARTSARSPHRA